MRVNVGPAAAQTIRGLPPATKRRIKQALTKLPQDPQGSEGLLDVKQLRSPNLASDVYRLRVGDWRIVFRLRGAELQVVRVFHRRDGYGWMDREGI